MVETTYQQELRHASFQEKLNVFVGTRFNKDLFVGAGWDIKQKFRIMYNTHFSFGSLTEGHNTHEVSCIFLLKKTDKEKE